MALATKCPHCSTVFRVANDQLKLRGGIVRCGACNEVFDGNAALIDTASPRQEKHAAPAPATKTVSASAAFDAQIEVIESQTKAAPEGGSNFTLDFDTAFDFPGAPATPEAAPKPQPAPQPVAPLPVPAPSAPSLPYPDILSALLPDPVHPPAPKPAPVPDVRSEPVFTPFVPAGAEVPVAAQDELDADVVDAAAAKRTRLQQRAAYARRKQMEAVAAAQRGADEAQELAEQPAQAEAQPEAEPEIEEPGFVKRVRQRQRAGRTRAILMAVGSFLLLLALLAQGLTTFRDQLAATFPKIKPALTEACVLFDCQIDLPAQIDALSIETGELQSLGANTLSFVTLLHNQSELAQNWPHLELVLSDASDKPVVRRVFAPADYLGGADPHKGFGARSEQAVKLYFTLNQVKASGYHVYVFYP